MYKCILKMIRNSPARCFVVFLVFFFSFVFFSAAHTLTHSATQAKNSVLKKIGAYVVVAPNHTNNSGSGETFVPPQSDSLLEQVQQIEGVIGYDPYNAFSTIPCTPIGFSNTKRSSGVIPSAGSESIFGENELEAVADSVNFIGSPSIQTWDEFRRGFSHLTVGHFPERGRPEVIVNSILAEENGLKIGDVITLRNIHDTSKEIDLTISGLYETSLAFEILPSNVFGQGIYRFSPYNRIYGNYDDLLRLSDVDARIRYFRVYVDDVASISHVMSALRNLSFDWEYYELMDGTSFEYTQYESNINRIMQNSKRLIFASSVAILILVSALAWLWQKSNTYEISVLVLLGLNRMNICLGRVLLYAMLAVPALCLALPIGYFLLSFLSGNLPDITNEAELLSGVSSFFTGEHLISQRIDISFTFKILPYMLVYLVGELLLWTSYEAYILARKTPHELVLLNVVER